MELTKQDISNAANEGRWMNLLDLHGEWDGKARILLAGKDSKQFRETTYAIQDRRFQKIRAKGAIDVNSKQLERQSIDLLAAATLGWEGIEENGHPITCSYDAARSLYRRFDFIREQVDSFVTNRHNFVDEEEEIDEASDGAEMSLASPETHEQGVEESL